MGFEDFKTIFGEPKAEWAKNSELDASAPLRRFLMHVFAPDYYHLKIQVTDYYSITYEAAKSLSQLEDMRDSIGIGGSWSEFVDYLVASLKAEDVKLVLEKQSGAKGVLSARLVGQKSKGMPLISISLRRVLDSDANDVMANISFGLFKAFKCSPNIMLQAGYMIGLETSGNNDKILGRVFFALDERNRNRKGGNNKIVESQLEKKQKLGELDDKGCASGMASNGSQNSPSRATATLKKASNRVVPAHRRTRVRGALIRDADDDPQN
ncbi:hypothetical protein LINPERPRIM_LOCUS35121 [Linum perenne]